MTRHVLGVGVLSVPERRPRLLKLLEKIGVPETYVALDMEHQGHVINWWQAVAIACASSPFSTRKPTHVLIIEDDAEPCPDFMKAVNLLIDIYPDRVISFFTRSPEVATSPEGSLQRVHDVPTDLAVVYPVKWLDELKIDYDTRQMDFARNKRRWGYGADEMRAELRPDKEVWATIPSLVEHGCPRESTLAHFYPTNIAKRYIGEKSALSIDWKAGKS